MDNDKIVRYRFTAYLIKSLAYHKMQYIQRKRKRHTNEELMRDIPEFIMTQANQERAETDSTLDDINNLTLDAALDKLKQRELNIIIMKLIYGYSLVEISNILRINYKTVSSIYSRSLRKLKDELKGADK